VYHRIFLCLQEDEVAFSNTLFQGIYQHIMTYFNGSEQFQLEEYLQRIPEEYVQEVTDILMTDEREQLHNWERRNIFVKQKDQTIAQYVSETILTLRWYLVSRLIDDLKQSIKQGQEADNSDVLALTVDYQKLINKFAGTLGRVMSRYN
jgi:DNA primase